jgi:hypothetical protein
MSHRVVPGRVGLTAASGAPVDGAGSSCGGPGPGDSGAASRISRRTGPCAGDRPAGQTGEQRYCSGVPDRDPDPHED